MASTVSAQIPPDPIARTAPRLSVVAIPQIVTVPGAAPAASTRARFRRLVVFTGLS